MGLRYFFRFTEHQLLSYKNWLKYIEGKYCMSGCYVLISIQKKTWLGRLEWIITNRGFVSRYLSQLPLKVFFSRLSSKSRPNHFQKSWALLGNLKIYFEELSSKSTIIDVRYIGRFVCCNAFPHLSVITFVNLTSFSVIIAQPERNGDIKRKCCITTIFVSTCFRSFLFMDASTFFYYLFWQLYLFIVYLLLNRFSWMPFT